MAMQSGTFIQTVVVQSMINKRLIAPIKEIMNGVSQAVRALGTLMLTWVGGILGKNDVDSPFLLVGIFDLILCVMIVILTLRGTMKE